MRWLTVDPGDTTGWALWEDAELVESGQTPNWAFVDDVAAGIGAQSPLIAEDGVEWEAPAGLFKNIGRIVCEDFLLYPWKLRDGSLDFDSVETARVIGAIVMLARLANIPFILQGADIKDAAVAGGAEELFDTPLHENRHANDAKMHGVFYIQTELLNQSNAHLENGKLVPNE